MKQLPEASLTILRENSNNNKSMQTNNSIKQMCTWTETRQKH